VQAGKFFTWICDAKHHGDPRISLRFQFRDAGDVIIQCRILSSGVSRRFSRVSVKSIRTQLRVQPRSPEAD